MSTYAESGSAFVTTAMSKVLAGHFELSLDEISKYTDPDVAELLAGLYFLNEDLNFQRSVARSAQAERDAAAQLALAQSTQLFELLLAEFSGFLWILDSSLRVRQVHQREQEEEAHHVLEESGVSLRELVGEGDPLRQACHRALVMKSSTLDWAWEERAYQVRVLPYRWAADQMGVAVLAFDVTEQRLLEERSREANRLSALGALAGGVAHDFNNLLTIIRTYADLVRTPTSAQGQKQDLDHIVAAVDRASELIQHLLAVGRRQVRRAEVVNLRDAVEKLQPMFRGVLTEGIELHLKLQDCGIVQLDPSQLEQVLMNLVRNARDALTDGGTITIETRPLSRPDELPGDIHDLASGNVAVLVVSDTGTGMDQATKARVFEPFFTTKTDMGSGLGLAATYGIVRQSGGGVSVQTELGKGSVFKVFLPISDKPSEVPSPAPGRLAPSTQAVSILFVDDESSICHAVHRILSRAGHDVTTSSSPEEALALAKCSDLAPDLLITDVMMPVMNGPELAGRLLEQWPDLPVLYVSGYSEDIIAKKGRIEAGTHLLAKPFTPTDLLAMIDLVLGERHSD